MATANKSKQAQAKEAQQEQLQLQEAQEEQKPSVSTKAQEDAKQEDKPKPSVKEKAYTLPEAYQMALRGRKFRRSGWKQKELQGAYITVKRGETKISFCKGKECVPYQPSQEDAIAKDWVEVSDA